jgi:CubicO group peptidase (beta-lactamase class C family)
MPIFRIEQGVSISAARGTGMRGRSSHIRQVSLIFIASAVLGWFATDGVRAQSPVDYFPADNWRTSSPEEQGLNKKRLKKLVKRMRRNSISGIDSLLIVRNGYLVSESYFNGWGPDDLHTLQSDTKSITSLLVGIARQQGLIPGIDRTVISFFPEYERIKRLDDRKAAMSLRDLLTMRTGFDWSEDPYEGSPLFQLNNCRCDWLKFTLDWGMREQPGTRFEYNSGGVILLGGIIHNVSGMRADTFAQRFLFDPLGITQARWFYGEPDNLPHMGGGLNLRPLDMAKIGYLVLRRGRWGNQQVVSEGWIAESLQHTVKFPRTFAGRPADYGYLWWLLHLEGGTGMESDADIYTAAGAQGQWIFVIPRFDMVVVSTGNTPQFDKAVDFLYSDILRAIE